MDQMRLRRKLLKAMMIVTTMMPNDTRTGKLKVRRRGGKGD